MEKDIYWLTQLRQTTRGNPDMKSNQILQMNRERFTQKGVNSEEWERVQLIECIAYVWENLTMREQRESDKWQP